ncbi:TPA: hypothetical protein QCY11_003947 [Bacillus cytotoxicus]|nr:hypothetical protein [Bacillus cytotoxicus]
MGLKKPAVGGLKSAKGESKIQFYNSIKKTPFEVNNLSFQPKQVYLRVLDYYQTDEWILGTVGDGELVSQRKTYIKSEYYRYGIYLQDLELLPNGFKVNIIRAFGTDGMNDNGYTNLGEIDWLAIG